MKIAFLKVGKFLSFLWHTIVSMFVKKKKLRASIRDVTHDGIDDLVITTDDTISYTDTQSCQINVKENK